MSAHGEGSKVEVQETERSHLHRGPEEIYEGLGCEGSRGEEQCGGDH